MRARALEVAERHPGVHKAAATFRFNGHGHTVFVTVDRFGGLHVGGGAMPVYIAPPYFGFPIAWDFEGNH